MIHSLTTHFLEMLFKEHTEDNRIRYMYNKAAKNYAAKLENNHYIN